MYWKHENEKKSKYNDRVLQIEKATFTLGRLTYAQK